MFPKINEIYKDSKGIIFKVISIDVGIELYLINTKQRVLISIFQWLELNPKYIKKYRRCLYS